MQKSNSPTLPLLLWLDLSHDRSTATLMQQFTPFAECRLLQSHSLVASPHNRRIDMICMHYDRPDVLGLNQLQQVKRAAPSIPITMFTVQHSEELAVWAMRSRVWEYLTLPLSAAELQRYRQALQQLCELRQHPEGGNRKIPSEHFPDLPASIRLTADHQKHQSLARALHYIDQHLCENIDQRDLAQLCGMTPSRFSRLFKDVHGVCYQEYVRASAWSWPRTGSTTAGCPSPPSVTRRAFAIRPTSPGRSNSSSAAPRANTAPTPGWPPAKRFAICPTRSAWTWRPSRCPWPSRPSCRNSAPLARV